MNIKIQEEINSNYFFDIEGIILAPRQFVAETYIIQTNKKEKLFCKIIDKPDFIPRIIQSLPALSELSKSGFSRLASPIKTKANKDFLFIEDTLIVMYDYIDAPQNYLYSHFSFGKLIGDLHMTTFKNDVQIKKEEFTFSRNTIFEEQFTRHIKFIGKTKIHHKLHSLLNANKEIIEKRYSLLNQSILDCSRIDFDFVVTHGDAPGNVLVKSPRDLFIIDWDDILLSPPERDLWFLIDNHDFMKGYKTVFPDYFINNESRKYMILSRHFNDITEYLAEILGNFNEKHQLMHIDKLASHLTGWIIPHLKSIGV